MICVLYSSLVVCFCLMFPQTKYEYDLLLLRQNDSLYFIYTCILYYYRMFSIPFQCTLYLLYTSRAVFIWRINYCHVIVIASVMKKIIIDKIHNIRAEFPLLEANLPSYSFLSMDSSMPMCPTSLHHFDCVTDIERLKIIYCVNKTTCSSDPFPTRLLSHLHAIVPILQHIVNLCLITGDFLFLVNHLL